MQNLGFTGKSLQIFYAMTAFWQRIADLRCLPIYNYRLADHRPGIEDLEQRRCQSSSAMQRDHLLWRWLLHCEAHRGRARHLVG